MRAITPIQRVREILSRSQGASIARGELVLDLQFIRDLLVWRKKGPVPEALAPADLLIEGCRVLELDLVCLQSDQVLDRQSETGLDLAQLQRFIDADLFVFWIVDGVFQSAVRRHGLMAVFSMIAKSPDVLAAEFTSASDQVMASMDVGVDNGAHGIILADDIAYSQSTYMSPDFIERYLQPVWKVQTAKANELGVPIIFHSDGNLNNVLPYIIDAGFDGLQCIEPSASMDIVELSAQYGHSLCLMGGIDPALLVHDATLCDRMTASHKLRRAVKRLLESARKHGGFIIGSCSGLYAGMSPKLVHEMVRWVSEFDLGYSTSQKAHHP